jgi:hypothetical protein
MMLGREEDSHEGKTCEAVVDNKGREFSDVINYFAWHYMPMMSHRAVHDAYPPRAKICKVLLGVMNIVLHELPSTVTYA